VHSLRKLVSNFRSRPKAHLAVGFAAIANHLTVVAIAAPAIALSPGLVHSTRSICTPGEGCVVQSVEAGDTSVTVPSGASPCPDSGPGASCVNSISPVGPSAGTVATPAGGATCANLDSKRIPSTPASCSDTLLDPTGGSKSGTTGQVVAPSVPVSSLGSHGPDRVALTSDRAALRSGGQVLLTATANGSVTATGLALEIFDRSSHQVVAACAQGSQCSVAYAASGGNHDFIAYIMPAAKTIPGAGTALASNHLTVAWVQSGIAANRTVVAPGQAVTLTATSSLDVHESSRWLEIYDITTNTRLTYCSHGTVCSTSVKEPTGGVHEIVGYVNGSPEAVSPPVYVTWLGVSLSATSIGPSSGGYVYLKAVANADLTNTPWVVGIYDQQGRLVDHACKAGSTCSVQAWMSGSSTPSYTAVIGALPTSEARPAKSASSPTGLVDVQARSVAIEPTHIMWGVDSCKAMTGDPSGEIFPTIVSGMGTPQFWGRYLTDTVCPGISSAEVALAAKYHIGILPIYNDYNCSNVSYYGTGHDYAAAAVAAARRIGIPKGHVLAIDIEPYGAACPGAGSVDSGFIEGWYDGISQAGYIPVYYGNGTSGSEFANAWCATVGALPNIAQGSDLWSFEPSLVGDYSKVVAPGYAPYDTGCAGNIEAWQFQLGSNGSDGDVDQDEALSSLPLWYPS
jgi:hypothetical protein